MITLKNKILNLMYKYFKKWLSKVTDDGVILFHDITETKGDFGVYKLWEELKIKYVTFEFSHSHGLGILLLKSSKIPNHQVFHGIWNNYYSLLHSFHEQRIVNERRMNPLMDRIGALEHEINEKNRVIREKNAEVQKIYNSISWRLTQPVRIIIDILRPARTKL